MKKTANDPEARSDEKLLFQAYSYLCVAATHLQSNFELSREINPTDLSDSLRAHWGSLPGVNAIYASKRVFEAKTSSRSEIVLGTGHAGLSTLIDAFLFGELTLNGSPVQTNLEGFSELSFALAMETEITLETGPKYPGPRFPTGSIGHGLGYAQGVALAGGLSNTLAVVGDGECEAGSTLVALLAQGLEFSGTHGLLPIINLNGFRMGAPSLFGRLGTESIAHLLHSFGLEPTIVRLENHDLSRALERICATYEARSVIRPNQAICLHGEKGYSAPNKIAGRPFAGSVESHKSILHTIRDSSIIAQTLNTWLRSYELLPFSSEGELSYEIANLIDRLKLPESNRVPPRLESGPITPADSFQPSGDETPIDGLRRFIKDKIETGCEFKLFSPDEASSNLGTKFVSEIEYYREQSETTVVIHEVLNEDLCLAWLVGWRSARRSGLMITYEAFAPVILNQLLQLRKYMRAWKFDPKRRGFSITIVVTSLGWTNSASHHEPFFTDALLPLIEKDCLAVHFPLDGRSVRQALQASEASELGIDIVVVDKHASAEIGQDYKKGAGNLRSARYGQSEKTEIVVVSIGSHAFQNVKEAIVKFNASNEYTGVLHACCEELACIFDDKSLEESRLFKIICESNSTIWAVNGRTRTIAERLRTLIPNPVKIVVHGYEDNVETPGGEARILMNGLDPDSIARSISESAIRSH